MNISGAEAVIRLLLKEKTEVIFGYPGGAIIPVYDTLYNFKNQLRHILVRHEQGAAHAAEGYARATGKVGVCLVTSGPGATNLVTGIADAYRDSIPIICITGQVVSTAIGTEAFQETNIIDITKPITKWNFQIKKAGQIPEIFSKAFFIAQDKRPGPVVIDLTKDAQTEKFEFDEVCFLKSTKISRIAPDLSQVKKAALMLNKAVKPLILAGHGVLISNASAELQHLSSLTGIPVATTLLGLSCVPTDFPNYVGMLGMHGNYASNLLTNQADVILGLGIRFDDRVVGKVETYAQNAKIIHVDIEAGQLNKRVKADLPIVADVKLFLKELIKLTKKNKRESWLKQFKHYYQIEYQKVIKKEIYPEGGQLKMGEVIRMLSEKTKGEAIIVADVGQNQMMTARYSQFSLPNSFITSGGLGTMGFALPAAVGACIGNPKRTVICVIGDGGFQMTIQELATIKQERLPVKIIVLNNNYLGMVRQWQDLFFDKRYSFVFLENPDFVKIAQGFFIDGEKVDRRDRLGEALEKLIKSPEAYLLEVGVETEGNVFPMIPSNASVDQVRLE